MFQVENTNVVNNAALQTVDKQRKAFISRRRRRRYRLPIRSSEVLRSTWF